MHDRYRVLPHKRLQRRLEHKTRHIVATNRVRPVQDDKRKACFGCRLHGEPHRRYVCVRANADILNIKHQHIDPAQHFGHRLLGGAVETEHSHAGLRITPATHTGTGFSLTAEAMLRRINSRKLHPFHRADGVNKMHRPNAPGLVGDQTNALTRKLFESGGTCGGSACHDAALRGRGRLCHVLRTGGKHSRTHGRRQ